MYANMIRAYIALVLLVSISQNFLSDLHARVKFKLSCTVAICEEDISGDVWHLCGFAIYHA